MGFVMPHAIILVAGGVVGLALILQIVGLATPAWVTFELTYPVLGVQTVSYNIGLWKVCASGNCRKISFSSPTFGDDDDDDDVPDWLNACRAFGILGVLAMAASLFCAVLTCVMSDKAKMFTLVAAGVAAVGAVCSMIEFAVYAREEPYLNQSSQHVSLGYSFILSVVAFVLAVVAVALFIVGQRKVQ
ncbi:uncharacterized protein LOC143291142 [Babylonia areolata]|uniref:uncharacterized protein LOC143291142 n=1 Tax=Babylonia areolata TaxID=304850 RepID=UPI003FD34462